MFFFSSRRRHTRWPRDWSSDVCSSDLITGVGFDLTKIQFRAQDPNQRSSYVEQVSLGPEIAVTDNTVVVAKIGRASCRERVMDWESVVYVKREEIVV